MRQAVAAEAATADRLTRKPNQCALNYAVFVITIIVIVITYVCLLSAVDGLFCGPTVICDGRPTFTKAEPLHEAASAGAGAEYSHALLPGTMRVSLIRLFGRCSIGRYGGLPRDEHAAHDAPNRSTLSPRSFIPAHSHSN